MDASKLRNSCICGNTLPYLECCGPFADPLPAAGGAEASVGSTNAGAGAIGAVPGDAPPAGPIAALGRLAPGGFPPATPEADNLLYHGFRHGLHELSMALFPLRALYQAYWEKLSKEDYPHDLLMEDPDYARAVVENFFWDHFVTYSDARPILRMARELEGKDLRLAHDLMQWSYAPMWLYRVKEKSAKEAKLLNLGNLKVHTVRHSGRMPEPGEGVLTRILPFRGKEFCGHTVLGLTGGTASTRSRGASNREAALESLFRAGCRDLGVKASVNLRPDVHCEEWRKHGGAFLALWRGETYDSKVGQPKRGSSPGPVMNLSLRSREALQRCLTDAKEVSVSGAGQWDLKYRALKVARMEAKGGNFLVTPTDSAFRAYVRDWLRGNLAEAAHVPNDGDEGAVGEGLTTGDAAVSGDMWVHTALDALNGQTPIQASTHDWGRRRLNMLLQDMVKQGRDVTSLRRQLGL